MDLTNDMGHKCGGHLLNPTCVKSFGAKICILKVVGLVDQPFFIIGQDCVPLFLHNVT